MAPPPLLILPILAIFILDFWQYDRIVDVRRPRNARAGVMTVATIGAFGGPLHLHYRRRDWRVSWGMVCLPVASFAGAYHLLRRVASGGAR